VGEDGESGGLPPDLRRESVVEEEAESETGERGDEGAEDSPSLLSLSSLSFLARLRPSSSSCSRLCLEATAAPVEGGEGGKEIFY